MSSGDIVIRVEGLSKRYRIGARERRAVTLRETVQRALTSPFDYLRTTLRPPSEEEILWALHDIDFEVARGEVIGLIGPNGAGKSTLLKILSRITEPTEGRAILRGRVSSLLEVGTGFHRELTGRDNVYLNGTILGMKRREIDAKFDEIVAFSGLEAFIDTQVKRYSSGMQVRLAFAVAAHLDPEILLVDEVLAVGDAEFRRKCLGKMDDVATSGRTLLFVSHNMGVVRDLCPTTLWIEHGRIVRHGPSDQVIRDYLHTLDVEDLGRSSYSVVEGKDFQISAAGIVDANGMACERFDCDQPVFFELRYRLERPVTDLVGYLEIADAEGRVVLFSDSRDHPPTQLDPLPLGESLITIVLPKRTLAPGEYYVSVRFTAAAGYSVVSPGRIGRFQLEDHRTVIGDGRPGDHSVLLDWQVSEPASESSREE